MWSFLKPLYDELKELETIGHTFTDFSGAEFISKCILLTCTCDLPARAIVYNLNQFNGEYSCWFCLARGETYKHDTGGISHIFPYDKTFPKGIPRTKESVRRDVQSAADKVRDGKNQKTTVNGHKGKFWFMYLDTFDVINSCLIDYMHGICLGIVKQLLTLWFDKKIKSENFSFFNERETVNQYLRQVKPTIFVTRIPRTLDNIVHWKSSEFRNFLLYWGIPILKNVLSSEYFAHFCLLARAIFILSKEGVTQNEIQTAEKALLLFVELYGDLYSQKYMTLNIHQIIHLADCVRHTGPLYVNNCFIFEDLNGFIIKHVHGTQGVDTQLTNSIAMLKVPPIMYDKFLKKSPDDEIISLYKELTDSVRGRHQFDCEIEDGIRPVGSASMVTISKDHALIVLKCGIRNTLVKCFQRINMYKKGFYVYSQSYGRLQKRQQHIVTCIVNGNLHFYSVLTFLQSDEKYPPRTVNVAMLKLFRKIQPVGCVWEVEEVDEIDFLPINSILNVNNFLVINDKKYICPSPNRYDRD